MTRHSTAFFVLLGAAVLAADPSGLQPRPRRSEYAVTSFTASLAVGATLLSSGEATHLFGAEAVRAFVIVEVGFYSKSHAPLALRHADFALRRRGSGAVIRPVRAPRGTALLEKALPEGVTTQALAGYLCFPAPSTTRDEWELEYTGHGAWLVLPLEPRR